MTRSCFSAVVLLLDFFYLHLLAEVLLFVLGGLEALLRPQKLLFLLLCLLLHLLLLESHLEKCIEIEESSRHLKR